MLSLSVITAVSTASDQTPGSGDNPERRQQLTVDALLDRAEVSIRVDLQELESLLLLIAQKPIPLDHLQRHRLMLLQANRLILETEFEQADVILDQLMKLNPNTTTTVRAIFFRAQIADILEDYQLAFLYLNRLDQYPKPAFSTSQQFEILTLATNLYGKAHAYKVASGFSKRALSLARKSKSKRLLCFAYRSKTDVLIASKKIDASKEVALEAINVCTKANLDIELAQSLINLSYWEYSQDNYAQQRILIVKAIALFKTHSFVVSMNSANLLLAEAYLLDNQILEAERILNDIFDDVIQLKVVPDLVLGYRIKALMFEKLGLPDDAMIYFKKYLAIQNVSNDLVRKINVAYLQSRFNSKIERQSDVISQIEVQNLDLMAKASTLTNLMILTTSLLFLSVSFYCFTFYRRRHSILMTDNSNFDDLTQLYKPECGANLAQKMMTECCSQRKSFGTIYIDIDFMSAVNNSFSFDFGDIVLQAFAGKVNDLVQDYGIAVRKCGDLFIVYTPDIELDELANLVTNIHQSLADLTVDRQKIVVSCSIGWTWNNSVQSDKSNEELSLLNEQASQALHQAKFNGRNQCVCYEEGKIDESLAEDDFRVSSY